MPRHRSAPRRSLDRRDLEILRDAVLSYILSAEPVSSKTVARFGQMDLSAATVRNIMADLEEWGYLSQPHTSAGRVPTPAGYHLFIDSLMRPKSVPAKERRYIEDALKEGSKDPEQLIDAASHLLSELSRQVGIVVAPAIGQTVLKRLEFVPLSGNKVLCVVVSAAGFVDNKVIATEGPVSREKLVEISNYLNESFGGMTLVEIRDRILAMLREDRAKMDQLLGLSIELARQGLEIGAEQEVRVDGTSTVLSYPELADIHRVRRLLDTFDDKMRLVRILNEYIRGEGVRVLIGEDSDLTSELDFSLVATTYGVADQACGTLAIFGPSRMEYERVIPLVHYLGERLSSLLAGSFSAGGESD